MGAIIFFFLMAASTKMISFCFKILMVDRLYFPYFPTSADYIKLIKYFIKRNFSPLSYYCFDKTIISICHHIDLSQKTKRSRNFAKYCISRGYLILKQL